MALSKKEHEVISNQLGRQPRGPIKVVCYTEKREPLVIKTNPIIVSEPQPAACLPEGMGRQGRAPDSKQYEPFPTLYYLTHPATVEAVSHLEDRGLIRKLEQIIEDDAELKSEFIRAQERYIEERLKITGERLYQLEETKRRVIEKSGVGGVKDLTRIKCLHAHYAHFLAKGDNPVGKMVHKLVNSR